MEDEYKYHINKMAHNIDLSIDDVTYVAEMFGVSTEYIVIDISDKLTMLSLAISAQQHLN